MRPRPEKTGAPREPRGQGPGCRGCRHYYVTWEPGTPHGCRLMGFKSHCLPAAVVRRHSGQECQAFEPRPGAAEKERPAS